MADLKSNVVFLEACITELDDLISSAKTLYYENPGKKIK